MESVMTKLEAVIEYGFPRGIGSTSTMLGGLIGNPNAVVLVADFQQAKQLNLASHQFITIDSIPESLRGLRKPLLIDHHALAILVRNNNEILLEAGDKRKLYRKSK